jgi:superfamily I DNA and/or RNA helicase
MIQVQSKEFLQEQVGHLRPLKYNKFQWWRNYLFPEPLSDTQPLLNRIINGDFDVSPYYWIAQMALHEMQDKMDATRCLEKKRDLQSFYNEKYRRLIQDYEKDEFKRMTSLKKAFIKRFKLTEEELQEEMENYVGSLEEMYYIIEEKYKKTKLTHKEDLVQVLKSL